MRAIEGRADPAVVSLPPDPVIVTGAPRTGVRLLASLLDAHPALASGPDLPILTTMVQQWRQIDGELGANHERHYGVTRAASREAFRAAALKLFAPRLERAGKRRFVVHSFTAAVLLDSFAALFPDARFVLMTRDAVDIARSLMRCHWRDARGEPLPYTRDAAAAARAAAQFTAVAALATPPLAAAGRLMFLAYEALCTDPADAMARLGDFLGEAPPAPRVRAASARLVARSPDNPHPPLRVGPVDSASLSRPRDPGNSAT
ncbi:MAG TPA: sulfotransferase [Woeseiaceae bacterium]